MADIERMKEYMESYLTGKGINTRKNFKCPICGGGDDTPPASFDPKTNRLKCFSCGWNGDIIDLIGHEYGITDDKEKIAKAAEVLNMTEPTPRSAKPKAAAEHKTEMPLTIRLTETAIHYLACRGIRKEMAERYGIRSVKESDNILIPYPGSDYYVTRSLEDKRYNYPKGMTKPLFNEKALYNPEENPVFIVEGQIDAISIDMIGYPVVALGGTGHYPLLEKLKEKPTDSAIIIALDNDEAGKAMAENLKKDLDEAGIFNLVADDIYGEHKDANEIFCKDTDSLAENLLRYAENGKDLKAANEAQAEIEYRKDSTSGHLDSFIKTIKENRNKPGISTGFPLLDKSLGGGLYPGLYGVGAISSLGKTTFALQIADYIAAKGRDVMIFSLEMSRNEIIAKSISRETYRSAEELGVALGNAMGTRDILQCNLFNNERKNLFDHAFERYSQSGAGNMFIVEGVGDCGIEEIKKRVQLHHQKTGCYPVVFIDYLQIIKPLDPKSSDKQNTDKAVFELKRISRDFDIPIIVISSLNRANYYTPISMEAFKESGAIEYSTDVLIGLQFMGLEEDGFTVDMAKRQPVRNVGVKILKNRNGQTGDYFHYAFIPRLNLFTEKGLTEEPKPQKPQKKKKK